MLANWAVLASLLMVRPARRKDMFQGALAGVLHALHSSIDAQPYCRAQRCGLHAQLVPRPEDASVSNLSTEESDNSPGFWLSDEVQRLCVPKDANNEVKKEAWSIRPFRQKVSTTFLRSTLNRFASSLGFVSPPLPPCPLPLTSIGLYTLMAIETIITGTLSLYADCSLLYCFVLADLLLMTGHSKLSLRILHRTGQNLV